MSAVICPDGTETLLNDCMRCASDKICPPQEWRFKYIWLERLERIPTIGEYHPSDLCFLCPRMTALKILFDYAVSINTFTIFQIGHGIHEWFEEPFKRKEVGIEYQVPDREYEIKLHLDILNKKDILYDIKTCSSFRACPKWFHQNQVRIYWIVCEIVNIPVSKMILWYVNKGTGEHRQFVVKPSQEITWDSLVSLCDEIDNYLRGYTRTIRKNAGDHCKSYCDVKKYCEILG